MRAGGAPSSRAEYAETVRKHIEETRQQATPIVALQAVVGNRESLLSRAANHRRHLAGQAAHMMGMDDVRARLELDQRAQQAGRDRVGGVAAHPAHGAQRPHPQTTGLALGTRVPAKGQQLAVDVLCQGAREFERVALAAAE